jgi:chromosome segregation ATPase
MKDIDKILSGSDKLKSAISGINDKILSIKREVEDNKNVSDICDNIIDANKKVIRELSNGNDLVKKLEDRKNEYRQGYTFYKDAYDELFPKADALRDENDKLKNENEKLKNENEKTNQLNKSQEERLKKLGTAYNSLEFSLMSAQKTRSDYGESIRKLSQEVYDLKNELNRKNREIQRINDDLAAERENKTNDDDDEEEPGIKVKRITIEGKKYLVDELTNNVYDYDIYKATEEQVKIGKYDPKKNKVTMKKSSKK